MSPTTTTVSAGSLLSDRLVGVGGLSNNARNRSCQHKENNGDLIIKDGKILLNEAILEEDLNEMKDALILLSKSNLTTTTTATATTSLRAEDEEEDDDDDDEEDEDEDDEEGSNINNNNNAVIYYTEQRDYTINLSPVLYATTTLSDCIGRNEIHTDMVRLLLLPFSTTTSSSSSSSSSSTSSTTTTTTTTSSRLLKISTNIRSIINVGYCNYKGIQLLPPLIRACHYQNYTLVRLLLDCGANVNVCGNSADGLTPLIRMVKIGDIKMIHMLLEKNSSSRREVNIHKYDQQSMNALIHACTENHIDIVRYLLDYSKIKNNNNNNIGTTDKSSDSDYVNEYKVDPPIWYACAHGNSDIVQLLIDDYGAKVAYRKDPNIYSSTPLMEACEWGHLSVVKILLERDNNGTSSSLSLSSSSSVPDEDETKVRSLLKARELARSAGYNKVVELIDLWSLRIQNIENTFINNNNIRIEDVNDDNDDDGNDNDDNDGRNNNKDDNDDDDDNGSDNEDENNNNNNNNNTEKKKQKQKKIDLIPPLLPIVLSMTARRYDLTYRIISRHKDIICQSCQQREASSSM